MEKRIGLVAPDAHRPVGNGSDAGDFRLHALGRRDDLVSTSKHHLAYRRQHYGRAALEQRTAKLPFERDYVAAQRLLRHVVVTRRLGYTAVHHDFGEETQVFYLHESALSSDGQQGRFYRTGNLSHRCTSGFAERQVANRARSQNRPRRHPAPPRHYPTRDATAAKSSLCAR